MTDKPLPGGGGAFSLTLPLDLLRPFLVEVVRETLLQFDAAKAATAGGSDGIERLCYTEAEAARMLGLHQMQLRDERRRGRIAASRIVGRRIAYLREDLVRYLMERRVEAKE